MTTVYSCRRINFPARGFELQEHPFSVKTELGQEFTRHDNSLHGFDQDGKTECQKEDGVDEGTQDLRTRPSKCVFTRRLLRYPNCTKKGGKGKYKTHRIAKAWMN